MATDDQMDCEIISKTQFPDYLQFAAEQSKVEAQAIAPILAAGHKVTVTNVARKITFKKDGSGQIVISQGETSLQMVSKDLVKIEEEHAKMMANVRLEALEKQQVEKENHQLAIQRIYSEHDRALAEMQQIATQKQVEIARNEEKKLDENEQERVQEIQRMERNQREVTEELNRKLKAEVESHVQKVNDRNAKTQKFCSDVEAEMATLRGQYKAQAAANASTLRRAQENYRSQIQRMQAEYHRELAR